MYASVSILFSYFILFFLASWTDAFIIYNQDVILYYDESLSATRSYDECKLNCQLLGGRLPNSLEELKRFDLHSKYHQTSDFWLGPVKEITDNHFRWPNGKSYNGEKSDWRKGLVDCNVKCCALTAISVLDENVRIIVKESTECNSLRRQLCIITNSPGKIFQELNNIQSYMNEMNESVEIVKSQLNELKSVKSNLTAAVTDLKERMKKSNLQFMSSTFYSSESNNNDNDNDENEKKDDENVNSMSNSGISSVYQVKPNDPYLIQAEDGSFYYFNRSRGSLEESEDFCQRLGGSLPSIHTFDESSLLISFIGKSSSLWLAARRENVNDPFYWLDDTPFNYTPWAPSYPSCKSNCCGIQLSSDRYAYGEIFDSDCSHEAFQVCKINPNDSDSTSKTTRLIQVEKQVKQLKNIVNYQGIFIENLTNSFNHFFITLIDLLDKH